MNKKTSIYIFFLFIFLNKSFSHPTTLQKDQQSKQARPSSSSRQVKMGGIHRVLPLMAKSTNGIISTTAGASMFIAIPLADAIGDQKPELRLKYLTRGEQGQFVFHRSIPIPFVNPYTAISWGLFQVNPTADQNWDPAARETLRHEFGHGVAVDMMGPLVLPIGLADYINSGTLNWRSSHYNNSFIEQAADMEANQSEMIQRQFHLGLSADQQISPGVYFFIRDHKTYGENQNPKTLLQTKQFRFLRSQIQFNPDEDCECYLNDRISGEFGLGEYETSMLVGDGLRLSLRGFYKVLDYKRDRQSDSRVDLYQGDNLVGVAIPLGGSSLMDLKGGISLRSSAYFDDDQFHLIDIYAGLAAEMNISIEDFVRLQAYYQTHAGTQSTTTRYGGSISSSIPIGESLGVDLSIDGEREIVSPDRGDSFQIDHLRFNAGLSF